MILILHQRKSQSDIQPPCDEHSLPRAAQSSPNPARPTNGQMDPTTELSIPSIHDSTPLRLRLYVPAARQHDGGTTGQSASKGSSRTPDRFAIVAHPYAPLGGSFDDPVVREVGRELLGLGYMVCTFNFRFVTPCRSTDHDESFVRLRYPSFGNSHGTYTSQTHTARSS